MKFSVYRSHLRPQRMVTAPMTAPSTAAQAARMYRQSRSGQYVSSQYARGKSLCVSRKKSANTACSDHS